MCWGLFWIPLVSIGILSMKVQESVRIPSKSVCFPFFQISKAEARRNNHITLYVDMAYFVQILPREAQNLPKSVIPRKFVILLHAVAFLTSLGDDAVPCHRRSHL